MCNIGSSGIGAATVHALAKHSPEVVYICARNRKTAEGVVSKVHSTTPNVRVEFLELDLGSFDSVRQCAQNFKQRSTRLHLLFLNAAMCAAPNSVTKDGYEILFQVNYLGHALLARLLIPTLLRTEEAGNDVRVISTSTHSGPRYTPKEGIRLDQVKTPMTSFWSAAVYGQSKLAQVLWAKKIAELCPQITCVSLHPGVVATSISRSMAQKNYLAAKVLQIYTSFFWRSGRRGM